MSWNCNTDIEEFYDWENGAYSDFLYQPLVDIVDACKEIDFCSPSDEKWGFAKIKQLQRWNVLIHNVNSSTMYEEKYNDVHLYW